MSSALPLGLASGALGFTAYGLAGSGVAFPTFVSVVALWGGFTGPSLQALMTRRVDAFLLALSFALAWRVAR